MGCFILLLFTIELLKLKFLSPKTNNFDFLTGTCYHLVIAQLRYWLVSYLNNTWIIVNKMCVTKMYLLKFIFLFYDWVNKMSIKMKML